MARDPLDPKLLGLASFVGLIVCIVAGLALGKAWTWLYPHPEWREPQSGVIAGLLLGGTLGPSIGTAWRVRRLGPRYVVGGFVIAGAALWVWWNLVGIVAQVVPSGPGWFLVLLQIVAFVGSGVAPGLVTAVFFRALRNRRRLRRKGD